MDTIIKLDKGFSAIIDSQDFELVSAYKWYARKGKNGNHYATSTIHKDLHMHRLILGLTDPNKKVDHINHNGLDNRRSNIRIATHIQNNCNKRAYPNKTSKFKGVYWNKEKCKWTVQITKPGCKATHVGNFKLESEAALAYNKKAKEFHGEFACLNEVHVDSRYVDIR